MLETSEILKNATQNSLVIIDELGRGTATFDGCGLAFGISKEIALNIKSYCLFATHFHELTKLSKEISTIENLFVNYEFNEENCELKMLYQVQKGVCDQKFGLHVAKMVQFPESMIKYAQEKVKKYEEIENPSNKDELEKLSNLIKNETTNLNKMNDEELINYLNQLTDDH
jgi:DNA mismatch repair protein MSH2